MLRRLIVRLAVALLVLAGGDTLASADFRVCNRSLVQIDVSFGYNDSGRGWTAQGWWNLPVGNCATVLSGKLTSRYYYLYATGESGRIWGSPKDQLGGAFCISMKKYLARNRDYASKKEKNSIDCQSAGLQGRKFRQVDTGGRTDFTINLTSRDDDPLRVPAKPPGGPTTTPAPAPTPSPPPDATPPKEPTAAGSACQRYPNLC